MKIARLYTGPDGESHIEDYEITLKPRTDGSRRSSLTRAVGMFLREADAGSVIDFHNASRRQFGIVLEGEFEIEVGDGSRRRFRPGDMFLAEDTTGRGHISRTIGHRPRVMAFVTLE